MFTSNAPNYAANAPFVSKMVVLLLAGINMAIFHLTAYRRIGQWNDALPPPRGGAHRGGDLAEPVDRDRVPRPLDRLHHPMMNRMGDSLDD